MQGSVGVCVWVLTAAAPGEPSAQRVFFAELSALRDASAEPSAHRDASAEPCRRRPRKADATRLARGWARPTRGSQSSRVKSYAPSSKSSSERTNECSTRSTACMTPLSSSESNSSNSGRAFPPKSMTRTSGRISRGRRARAAPEGQETAAAVASSLQRLSERSACGTRVERASKTEHRQQAAMHMCLMSECGEAWVCKYSSVQYRTVQYSTVQYSTVHYSTGHYSTKQYSSANRSRLAQDVDDRARPEHAQIEKCSNDGDLGDR